MEVKGSPASARYDSVSNLPLCRDLGSTGSVCVWFYGLGDWLV